MRLMPAALLVITSLLAAPAYALPGPLRVAEVKLPAHQAPLHRNTTQYATETTRISLFELACAKLALQKSRSAEVRKFATMMVEAHNDTSQNLKQALTAASVRPTLPTALDNAHVALLNQLRQSSGIEFETRYIQQQIDTQTLALEMHQSYARRGEDNALKRFATDMETRIAHHLAEAQKISHSLGGLQPRA